MTSSACACLVLAAAVAVGALVGWWLWGARREGMATPSPEARRLHAAATAASAASGGELRYSALKKQEPTLVDPVVFADLRAAAGRGAPTIEAAQKALGEI